MKTFFNSFGQQKNIIIYIEKSIEKYSSIGSVTKSRDSVDEVIDAVIQYSMQQASQEEEEVNHDDDPDDALQAAKTLAMFAQHSSDRRLSEETVPPGPSETSLSHDSTQDPPIDIPSTSKGASQTTSSG